MDQFGNINTVQTPRTIPPRTSGFAIASFIMGLLSFVVCFLWPLLALPAIVCGIIALVQINSSKGALKGTGFAITGIVIPAVMLVLIPMLLAILMPALSKTRHIAQQVICGANLKGLGNAFIVYTSDYDGQIPPADQWCDLLITKSDVHPRSFICPSSDAIEGESSYAMNINAVGKDIDELPANMVLLFETDAGKKTGPRSAPISDRSFYVFMEEYNSQWIDSNKNEKVYPGRWNQTGGPEIISTPHEMANQYGCNIVFVDGHTEFVSGDDLQELRWTEEDGKNKVYRP